MEGGGTWGGQRVGFRIDKIKSVSQLFWISAPNGMKIGMDVAWVVESLLETRFVWGREGDIRGTARFLQAPWQLPHPTAMPLGTRTHRASFQFEGPSPFWGSD
jgi:hypothetical protein